MTLKRAMKWPPAQCSENAALLGNWMKGAVVT